MAFQRTRPGLFWYLSLVKVFLQSQSNCNAIHKYLFGFIYSDSSVITQLHQYVRYGIKSNRRTTATEEGGLDYIQGCELCH